ncbi:MAG: prepilin-type N-terminal cleavage/methylation domain-containing protein [Planctomycetes bacterium]|nr:prepilin-type N-terminal cleavage/methylation domain-containing protein [Planctomycetota bacterium]
MSRRRPHFFNPAALSRAGFSLIEVLIAMVILSIGATSLIALFAAASSAHKRAVDRTHAALVAEELFSEVQSRYRVEVDLKELLKSMKESLPEQIDGYFWQITLHQPAAGKMKTGEREWGEHELLVRAVIRWSRAAESREEEYLTILLPRNRQD